MRVNHKVFLITHTLSFDFQSVRRILPYSDNVKHTEEAGADPGLIKGSGVGNCALIHFNLSL